MIAQARLGPGRIHHCMRAIGAAERALELMCRRALARETFGEPVATRATSRTGSPSRASTSRWSRLLTLKTAWLMDTVGNQHARTEIAAIKVAAPNVALKVIDRAIQVHGGGGVSDDFPLALDLRAPAHAAPRRRPRRGAQAVDRAARAAAVPGGKSADAPEKSHPNRPLRQAYGRDVLQTAVVPPQPGDGRRGSRPRRRADRHRRRRDGAHHEVFSDQKGRRHGHPREGRLARGRGPQRRRALGADGRGDSRSGGGDGPGRGDGPAGAKGDTGATGPKGDTGAAGTNGAKGEPGTNGAKGDPGTNGAKGDTGDRGPSDVYPVVGPARRLRSSRPLRPTGRWWYRGRSPPGTTPSPRRCRSTTPRARPARSRAVLGTLRWHHRHRQCASLARRFGGREGHSGVGERHRPGDVGPPVGIQCTTDTGRHGGQRQADRASGDHGPLATLTATRRSGSGCPVREPPRQDRRAPEGANGDLY